jgi:pyridoxal phosphate-dependent aminotransferase EpsN
MHPQHPGDALRLLRQQLPAMRRIHLSVPHMEGHERALVADAFDSNWLSSVGPHLDAFEREFAAATRCNSAVALSSGTAAIHLGLRLLGVGPGDEVLSPTLTFVASVNPIVYLGARPVFLDCDRSWNLDPQRLRDTLVARARNNKLPRAVVVVHLYGKPADLDAILESCARYDVPVLEDAAEALGTQHRGRQAGTIGQVGAFSFNGNKIITTTGGGMLATRTEDAARRARFWATQAREPGVAYAHAQLGYNYRLSNVLAAIGRGQLQVLEKRVAQRRAVAFAYRDAFADLEVLTLMPEPSFGRHTYWLSAFLLGPGSAVDRDGLLRALEAADIEARPVWKPMHLQPLHGAAECVGGSVAEDLFRRGICLPSSSSLDAESQQRVIDVVRKAVRP